MIYTSVQHMFSAWLPNWWITPVQRKARRRQPTPARQIQLQPEDAYYLDAGVHRVRVLSGSIWIPEMGIFAAGEQVRLTPDQPGLWLRTYQQQPVVLEVRTSSVSQAQARSRG